jgi:hypothetical protein
MGTRSDIIVERTNGTWARVYCRWDGYPRHHGPILRDHYSTQTLAEALVASGDMSSLAERCDKPHGHTFDHPIDGYCTYYGRDCGETGTAPTVGRTLKSVWPKDTATEYTYVFRKEGGWYVGDTNKGEASLMTIDDALAGINTPEPHVKAFGLNFVIGKRKTT